MANPHLRGKCSVPQITAKGLSVPQIIYLYCQYHGLSSMPVGRTDEERLQNAAG